MTDRQIKWSVIRFVITLAVAVGLVVYISVREGNTAREVREGQVESCEDNGTPMRETLTEILQEQIDESHSPLTSKIAEALHLTDEEAQAIIKAQNEKRRERIKQIKPFSCEKQYE